MTEIQQPSTVETEGDYVRVRYHDPDEFESLRTPEWARKASESVVDGSEVRLGKRTETEHWIPLEVLIPEPVDPDDARRQANEIIQRIEY